MRHIVIGFIVGVLTTILVVAVTGGWYDYRVVNSTDEARNLIERDRWQVVFPELNYEYLRRPRLHIP